MRFAALLVMAAMAAALGGCWDARPHTACGGRDLCGGADAVAWLEESGW